MKKAVLSFIAFSFVSATAFAVAVSAPGSGTGSSQSEACREAQREAESSAASMCSRNGMESIAENASARSCSERRTPTGPIWSCGSRGTANC